MRPRDIVLSAGIFITVMFSTWWVVESKTAFPASYAEHETEFEDDSTHAHSPDLDHFTRPPGPPRVGIQAGHYQNDAVPEELSRLTKSGAGATSGSITERDVVLEIAEQTVALLASKGIEAVVLPATVPPSFIADAFVSIHADANPASRVSGYKIAAPRRDESKKSAALAAALYEEYGKATKLRKDDGNITKRMRGYYAFNWRKYTHAVHPMTPSAIIEAGFVTSPTDQAIIVSKPEIAATGIANGVVAFLTEEGLLTPSP